jgi:hypothetical protein
MPWPVMQVTPYMGHVGNLHEKKKKARKKRKLEYCYEYSDRVCQ